MVTPCSTNPHTIPTPNNTATYTRPATKIMPKSFFRISNASMIGPPTVSGAGGSTMSRPPSAEPITPEVSTMLAGEAYGFE